MNQILMQISLFISYGGEFILSIKMMWGQLQKEYESTVQWLVCSVEMWKTCGRQVCIFLPTNVYLYETKNLQIICLNIREHSLWAVLSRMSHKADVPRRSHSETISLPSLWYSSALCVRVLNIIYLLLTFNYFIYFCETKHWPQWQSQVTTTADCTVSGQMFTCHTFFKL